MKYDLNLLKAGISVIAKPMKAWNTPLHLQVEPTNDCNLTCKFCSREENAQSRVYMSFENFKKIFDQINPQRVTWAGRGEPLMAKDLTKMISYAKGKGAKTVVTTNFTLGKALAGKLVEAGIDDLRISIDTSDAKTYKSLRGKDFHGRILEGIAEVNKLKDIKGLEYPKLGFEIVLTKENFSDGKNIIRLAKEYKVSRVDFRPLGLVGIEDKKNDLTPKLTYEEFLMNLEKWRDFSKTAQVKTNLDEFIDRFPLFWARYKGGVEKAAGCIYLWLQCYINATGEVTPCCALNMDEGISMGNAFQKNFMDVWNGENYTKFRKATEHGDFLFKSCRQCTPKKLMRTIKRVKFLS